MRALFRIGGVSRDHNTGTDLETGRVNQKRRTQAAILAACRQLVEAGAEVNMPAVATAALVSEATAYRYFPDLLSLLREAMRDVWPEPRAALQPVAACTDPAQRIAYATEVLLRHVLAYQSAVRATIAATITRPQLVAGVRPGYRFGLIDHALAPLSDRDPPVHPHVLAQLKRDLAVIVSAEALFTLTDLCGLAPEEAIASVVHTAQTVTRATITAQAATAPTPTAPKRTRSRAANASRRRPTRAARPPREQT